MSKFKITKDDHPNIAWLLEDKSHGLLPGTLSEVVRLLIEKHNALVDHMERAEDRLEEIYSTLNKKPDNHGST